MADGQLKASVIFTPQENSRCPFNSKLSGLQNWTVNNGEDMNPMSLCLMETQFLPCPALILFAIVTMIARVLLLLIQSAAFSISVVTLVHHTFVAQFS